MRAAEELARMLAEARQIADDLAEALAAHRSDDLWAPQDAVAYANWSDAWEHDE